MEVGSDAAKHHQLIKCGCCDRRNAQVLQVLSQLVMEVPVVRCTTEDDKDYPAFYDKAERQQGKRGSLCTKIKDDENTMCGIVCHC